MKKIKPSFLYLFLFTFFLISNFACKSIDKESHQQQIQHLMAEVTAAHFEQNATKFYAPNATEWWDVRNGQITKETKSQSIAGTQSYLDNMEFLELLPSHDPIIEISEDASLASYIGAVHVKGRYVGTPIFWVVAWQSVLKNQKGNWKIIQTANTEMPEAQMAEVVLAKSRNQLLKNATLDSLKAVFALANCNGPDGDFQTLLMCDTRNTRFEQKLENRHVLMGINEAQTWGENLSSNKTYEQLDTFSQFFVHGHELHWLSWWPETRFNDATYKGFKEFAGKTAFDIELKDVWERPVHFYYDFENYQPLGFTITNETPAGTEIISTYFNNWEMVNDLLTFTEAEIHQGDAIYKYDFIEIKWNSLSPSDFEDRKGRI